MSARLARVMAGMPAYDQPYKGPHNSPYAAPQLPSFQPPRSFGNNYMPPMSTSPHPAASPPQSMGTVNGQPTAPGADPHQVALNQALDQAAARTATPTAVPPMPPSQPIGMAPGMEQPNPDALASFWEALKNPRQASLPPQMANGQYTG